MNAMDKLSLTSVNKGAVPYVEKSVEKLNWTFSAKQVVNDLVSKLSLMLYNFHQNRLTHYKRIVENRKGETIEMVRPVAAPRVASISISEQIWNDILVKLELFEIEKGYLNQHVSLNSLAKNIGTNHSYLSKTINSVKGKSFKNYLNDLRIAHAYTELQKDAQLRKFTIEAIAFENGFKSAESFSKKFKEKYDIYPSKFLKTLEA